MVRSCLLLTNKVSSNDREGIMRGRRSGSIAFWRKRERLAQAGIELGPVEVEMLKVLLRTVAQTGGHLDWDTGRAPRTK